MISNNKDLVLTHINAHESLEFLLRSIPLWVNYSKMSYERIICLILSVFARFVFCEYLEYSLTTRTDKDGTKDVDILNRGSFIGIKANVGKPAQEVELLLDTGSSSTWIMSTENPYCVDPVISGNIKNSDLFENDILLQSKNPIQMASQPCYKYGVFDKKISENYNETTEEFHVKYFDKTVADGFWGKDDFHIGDDYRLNGFEFGLGVNSNSSMGVLGLSIPEFKVKNGVIEYEHDNFIMKLHKSGYINRQVFSLWLNEKDSIGGKILFGAVDYAKFESPLITMKMINTESPGNYIERFELMLTDISFQQNIIDGPSSLFNRSESYQGHYTGASVDSGAGSNYFPTELFNELISQLSYIKIEATDQYLVECINDHDKSNEMSLSFKFASTTFTIPFRNFLLPKPSLYNKYTNAKSPNGKEYCLLNIMEQENNYTILGQSFLRSVYTVFDLDKMEISMAPVIFTNRSEILEINLDNPIISIPDGDVAEELRLQMYDPKVDFLQDYQNGYYQKIKSDGSHFEVNCYIARMVTILMCTFFAFMCL